MEANKILAGSFALNTTSYDPANPDPIWYKTYVEATAAEKAIPSTIKTFESLILRGEIAEMVWRLKEHIKDKPSLTYEDLAGASQKSSSSAAQEVPKQSAGASGSFTFYAYDKSKCEQLYKEFYADSTVVYTDTFAKWMDDTRITRECVLPEVANSYSEFVPAVQAAERGENSCETFFAISNKIMPATNPGVSAMNRLAGGYGCYDDIPSSNDPEGVMKAQGVFLRYFDRQDSEAFKKAAQVLQKKFP